MEGLLGNDQHGLTRTGNKLYGCLKGLGAYVALGRSESNRRNFLDCQGHCQGTLLAVADGSYIRKQHPDLCAAAFILECTRHQGMLVGSFPEAFKAANAFQGELLGLMAIHLLLLAVNTVSPGLAGWVKIYLDCLGALGRTAELPPYCIPTRCKHSDVLKMILGTCGGLSFHREYIHVEAHQDDLKRWEDLLREAQLNAACDAAAKAMLRLQDITDLPQQEPFPLELLCMFVEGTKMTSDMRAHI
jgi:hypothetical protein